MKQKLSRAYFHITDKLADTPISQIPRINNLHSGMLKVLNWASDSPESHRWITYDGHHLYINPDDHVSEILYQTGRYEPRVRDEINEILENGDIAIDVGGHLGQHSITMRRCVGENGQVMVFEPHPKNANNIRKTIDKNNWNNIEVYEKALSNEEGKTILEENPTNTGGSTIKSEMKSGETYEVEVMRLSEYLSKKDVNNISLIKIDVEGGEINIIKDINYLLDNIETIIVEIHGDILSENDKKELYNILHSEGNIISLTDGASLSEEEFLNIDSNPNIKWINE